MKCWVFFLEIINIIIFILVFLIYFIGVDLNQVDNCIGDPNADVENPVLSVEQEAQVQLFLLSEYMFYFYISLPSQI